MQRNTNWLNKWDTDMIRQDKMGLGCWARSELGYDEDDWDNAISRELGAC